jgi:anti-sigma regulatory factor (Ser/Thr protein kinase)/RimJ/RimL family protein N-acetyltransferase
MDDFFRLTIPNDQSYLSIAQASVKEGARYFGFEDEDLYKIELGLEEAFMNVVKHAFDTDERSTFDIICERIPMGMKITIREKGIPFDPGRLPSYKPADDPDAVSGSGLGTCLMRGVMDEVSFHNLGAEGKEMHLIKYLRSRNIENYFEASELVPHEDPPKKPTVIAERVEYDVRRMASQEAIEVSKGAYRSHGYTFFDESIYYPEQIIGLNNTNELISAVAVTKDGRFMGHAALHYPYPGAPSAELTYIFVNPEYRSQGCMIRMLDFLFNTEKKYKLSGVYAFAVTNHIFSQKTILKHGLNDCGIELATSPATWVFKGISGEESQRMSVVLSYKYLEERMPLVLYPPGRHRDIIERLYRNILAENTYKTPGTGEGIPEDEQSVIETTMYASEGNAEIFIKKYGTNVTREVKNIVRNLCIRHIVAINLFLKLEDPATYWMSPEFEKMDFFFSGIAPNTQIGDALILQYLNNIAFDYDKVIAYSDVAKEILVYIKGCDPAISA